MVVYPKSVSKKNHQVILNQMNYSICSIIHSQEIGFFCYIKYNKEKIRAIIINNYISNEKYIDKINVIINNKEEIIDLDKIIYKDKLNNITIIKIKNNNKIIKFIEIDDKLYENESEMNYRNESIYIIQKTKDDMFVSYSIIKEINKNEIIYNGNINSNHSLIFNLNNNKLIGIYNNKYKSYNKGIYIKSIIKEIKNYITYKYEIDILINIEKEDINKKIFFLNDEDNDLQKLNEYNAGLYINSKKEIYKAYIESKKIGINRIILKFNYNLKNIKNMFKDCEKIIDINFFDFNFRNITNMEKMFYECNNLKKINFYSFDIKNIHKMNSIFYGCGLLNYLPDISKWDTKNVEDMNCMFYGCSSLNNLPDISKWDTKNVQKMSYMFYGCNLLNNLPDISKWDTKNVKFMSYMFSGCSSLNKIPDISQWDTKNVQKMSCIFSNCSSLNNLPDISKWDTKNVKDMSSMFSGCGSLNKLPDISKWDTKNVKDMSSMFFGCSSLNNLPDISKWDTKNVENKSYMFEGCNSLNNIPKKFL